MLETVLYDELHVATNSQIYLCVEEVLQRRGV